MAEQPHNWLHNPDGTPHEINGLNAIASCPISGGGGASGAVGVTTAKAILKRLDECNLEVREKRNG
jgi:hypothetical protein